MKNFGLIVLAIYVTVSLMSCKRDDVNSDKLSTRIGLEREIAAPLVYGELSVQKMAENNSDSLIVIDGDTVKLVVSQDSIINVKVGDVINIPEQTPHNFNIVADTYIPAPPITGERLELTSLALDTTFAFDLNDSMRIDKIILNEASLNFDITNNFQHDLTLIISSETIRDLSNNPFLDSISDIGPGENRTASFNIDGHTILTSTANNNKSGLNIMLTPVITTRDAPINAGDAADITFGIDQIEDFNAIFGYFGNISHSIDSILEGFGPESIENLEGQFNVANTKIKLDYLNSMGVPINLGMLINLTQPDAVIDFGTMQINNSSDYLNPGITGSFLFDESTANIDKLISFPMPEAINIAADAEVNVGVDSATAENWVVKESEFIMNLNVEMPLELRADLTYLDTMQIRSEEPSTDENYEIEYAELHYTFENYFPLGFGGDLILYDSINNIILDTIKLNETGEQLIAPAPVDQDGNVVNKEVKEHKGFIDINASAADDIINLATHAIFRINFMSTGYTSSGNNSVRIGIEAKLKFHFGIDAKGRYNSN